jgi:hypothetical protein
MLLVKLLLAHFLADFIFQPDSWVKSKERGRLKSRGLYLHFLTNVILVFLIVWDLTLWLPLIIYLSVHFLVDILKISFPVKGKERVFFFIDQALHLITILVFWIIIATPEFSFNELFNENVLVIITGIVFLTTPSSIIIRELLKGWSEKIIDGEHESLRNAGKYIGILERLFVFMFFLLNQWIAIGFLITAKSVFRYGDLSQSKDRRLTEYILIGTLTSFGFALMAGLLVSLAMK